MPAVVRGTWQHQHTALKGTEALSKVTDLKQAVRHTHIYFSHLGKYPPNHAAGDRSRASIPLNHEPVGPALVPRRSMCPISGHMKQGAIYRYIRPSGGLQVGLPLTTVRDLS